MEMIEWIENNMEQLEQDFIEKNRDAFDEYCGKRAYEEPGTYD